MDIPAATVKKETRVRLAQLVVDHFLTAHLVHRVCPVCLDSLAPLALTDSLADLEISDLLVFLADLARLV